ncbi:MAG: SPOR domain-containing protein [Rhodoferax sp.]
MRKRAKYRLIGAAVLVLIGVIGFPLLFDKQPRPISVDLPIEIPDKNKVKSLSIPAPAALPVARPQVGAVQKTEEEVIAAPVPDALEAPKVVAKVEPKSVDKPVDKPVPAVKAVAKAGENTKAQILQESKEPEKKADASEGRFVVQVGAYADAARAREARAKLEHAGLKTYTHVAETKDGSRIRVRVGPFGTRVEADKVAQKIKKLDLPAAILTL